MKFGYVLFRCQAQDAWNNKLAHIMPSLNDNGAPGNTSGAPCVLLSYAVARNSRCIGSLIITAKGSSPMFP